MSLTEVGYEELTSVTPVGDAHDPAMWLAPRRTVSLAPRALRQASLCSAANGDCDYDRGLRVGVIGLGAIGTIFFTQLSRVALQPVLNGHHCLVQSVEAFVKPTHFVKLTQQGSVALSRPREENVPFTALRLKETDGGLESAGGTSRIQTLESEPRAPLDVVLLALKANDSARVIEELQTHHAHRFRRDAVFVLLQNGLGAFPSHEAAANQIDTAYQYANAVTYVGGRMQSMGHVVVSGMETEPTYFAPVTASETQGQVARERLRMLSDALVQSGLRSQVLVPREMQTILWRKLIVNAAINPIAALLNTPNGHVGACEWSRRSVEAVVQEAVVIAKREHVDLQATEQELVECVLRVATNTSENVCSTLADLRKGARTEIDALTGQIVRSGEKHGIPTPVNALLFDLVKALEAQRLRALRPEDS